ncbi:MAG: ABC transporter ATP-binding protein [Hyphomicrobiales bacterium]
MKDIIKLKSVSHYFGQGDTQITLFKDLNLTIEAGSSYSIVGPSGAGKSSLLTLLAGLENPCQGSVEFVISGQSANFHELRKNSGFIFQQFHLLPELDAVSNLALPLRLRGDKQANDKARIWLEKVGLSARAHHKPNQLSGGEQQRIAIARAFVTDPLFIFADEPTGNLDQKTSTDISDMMFEFCVSQQCAMVVVTHSQNLADRADHQYRLSQRKLEVLK